ncbi:hypothetical protein BUALT_Bualt13G0063400 [Buddleja alternifolia]|uniref:AT-hook motif nuclear-localized protein n=1 Tax=Buddleja alternifolia TaxID=168488 RepID=A0AAV6WLZ6_9LAMI|nr:hypothetical protein BUALT_Bualt13G0063400 [Buddleja alternifolia]
MEGENKNDAAPQEVFPVSETAEVAVGVEEKSNDFGGDDNHGGVAIGAANGGEADLSGKRKRGRPRKQPVEVRREFMAAAPELLASPQKRGRGRPKGSGNLRASYGGTAVDSTGSNFTPHIITVQTGENIVQRICSFSQSASESICILSACGTVSTAEIIQPGSCGGILRYNGRFEIVSLNGSRTNNGRGGQNCVISVQLANQDCRLFGGAIAGSLIAGGPTQLVIATFRQKLREQLRAKHSIEPLKPSNEAVPERTENGKLVDAETSGLPPVSAVPAPPFGDMDKMMNGPDVINHASSQPFYWNALQ